MWGPSGDIYRITAISEDLLQAWFDEWLPRIYPPGLPHAYGLPTLHVHPIWQPDLQPDWCQDARLSGIPFQIPRDPAQALAAIAARRAELEEKAAALAAREKP